MALLTAVTLPSAIGFGVSNKEIPLDSLPPVKIEAVPPDAVDIASPNYVSVGDSNSSQFGQLLWEQQDSVQQEVLNGLNGLGPGFTLFTHSMDKNDFQISAGVDITAKRYFTPINLGLVDKDGTLVSDPNYPNQKPRSGWVVVDYLRTGLTQGVGTRDLFANALPSSFNNGSLGFGFEAGQIIRKVSIINSAAEFDRLHKEDDEQIKKGMGQMNASQNPIQEGYQGYFIAGAQKVGMWVIDGLAYVGGWIGTAVHWTAGFFESKGMADVVYSFADPYKLKKELFYTDDQKVLAFVHPGQILSMITFKDFGPGVGGTVSAFKLSLNNTTLVDSEIRINRLTPSQCGLKDDEVCKTVLVSFINYMSNGFWDELDGLLPLHNIRPWWTRGTHVHFYQTEEQYKYDLSNPDAVLAFNEAVNPNHPSMEKTHSYAKISKEKGVRKQFYSVIGDAKEMDSDSKKDDNLKMSGVQVYHISNFNILLASDIHRTETDYYKKCQVDFDDGAAPLAPPQCTYDGLSQKTTTKLNLINLGFLMPIKMLKPMLDFRAHMTEQKEFETFTDLNAEVDQKGSNFHFRYTLSDKFPKPRSYYDGHLKIVKTMLGLMEPRLKGFYDANNESRSLRDKIMVDLSNKNRHLEQKIQGLVADIYMNQAYTNEIFAADPQYMKDAIAGMLMGHDATWDQMEKLNGDADNCKLNKNYDGMIIPELRDYQSIVSDQDNAYINCGRLRTVAHQIWKTFSEIAKSDPQKRLELFTIYNEKHQRRPYIPLLMLIGGRNHAEHVKNGELGIQFYYEAQDLVDTNNISLCKEDPQFPNSPSNRYCKLEGFKPYIGQDALPSPGTPRIVNLTVLGDKQSFASPDAAAPLQRPFSVKGYVTEYRPVAYNKPVAQFEVATLMPQEEQTNKGHKQYRYTLVLSDLTSHGIQRGKDYVLTFNMQDPTQMSDTKEHMAVSEMAEVRFRIPKN